MVSIDQVFSLLDKGFSRDDIMALVGSGTQAETAKQEPAPEPNPEPKQNPEPAKPAKPEPAKPAKPEPAKPAKPEPAKPAKPEPAKPAKPEPAKPAKPEPAQESETDRRLDSIETTMTTLLKAIQANNLANDSFGKAGKSLEEQTDDIMATIIRGTTARKEDAI